MKVILYAEDDPNDVCLFQMAARRASLPYTMETVQDGQAAVDWLAGRGSYSDRTEYPTPSLLVLDIKMPRLNGLQVLEWVRAQENLKDIPVIMLSSSGEAGDQEKAARLGATRYFVKSASYREVVEYLASVSVSGTGS